MVDIDEHDESMRWYHREGYVVPPLDIGGDGGNVALVHVDRTRVDRDGVDRLDQCQIQPQKLLLTARLASWRLSGFRGSFGAYCEWMDRRDRP